MVIRFAPPSPEALRGQWQRELARHGLSDALTGDQVVALSQRHGASPALLGKAAALVSQVPPEHRSREAVLPLLETILACRKMEGTEPDAALPADSGFYEVTCLNTSVPAADLVESARG